jgi:methyltransferase (TIGR00027 family)
MSSEARGEPRAAPGTGAAGAGGAASEPVVRRSLTADIVSIARGIGVSRQLRDPLAIHFASAEVKPLLEAFAPEAGLAGALRAALRRLSFGLVDHNTLRMLLIDGLLREWLASGCRQVVIVGAGMDSRGWRLAELADARLFELDRAPTQALKRARSARLPEVCRDVRFVQADLERDRLAESLLREGFRADEAAAWVCEGVTPYLGVDTIARLLAQIGQLSAPGSRLAMSYVVPNGVRGGRPGIAARLAARLGEPPRGLIASTEMQRHAVAAGLACVADLDWQQWVARFPTYHPVRNVFKERLLVAERATGASAARVPAPRVP